VGNSGFLMRSKISTSYKEFQKAGGFLLMVLQPNSSSGITAYLAVVRCISTSSYLIYQMLYGAISVSP